MYEASEKQISSLAKKLGDDKTKKYKQGKQFVKGGLLTTKK